MTRKVIIDCDPGIDDAIALCLALFDPRLEVVAVTAAAGNVDAHQASRNVQTILELLDPPRWPRLGAARTEDSPVDIDTRHLNGADGLGNLGVKISELHHPRPSDKVISDAVRNDPGEVSILALGPLTNVARALGADPEMASMVDQVIVSGGSVEAVGNVTATAEFNIYCDPASARTVLRSPLTKTLMVRDITESVPFTLDFLDRLPDDSSRAGHFVRSVLPFLYRSSRQQLGVEAISLGDAVCLMYAVHAELFETQEMAGDVETVGELTRGMTVFDRRARAEWRTNMAVVTACDAGEVQEAILRGLRYAAQETTD